MHETCTQGISYSGYLHWAPNVTGVKEPCLNWDSKPGPLAYCESTLTTELLRPDMLTELL